MKSGKFLPWLVAAAITLPLAAADAAVDGEPMRLDVAQLDSVTAGRTVAFNFNFSAVNDGEGLGFSIATFGGDIRGNDVFSAGVAGGFSRAVGTGAGRDATATSNITPQGDITYGRNVSYGRTARGVKIEQATSAAFAFTHDFW